MFVEEYLVCCGIHVFTITINSYSLFSHFLLHTRNNYSLLKSSYACEIQLRKKARHHFIGNIVDVVVNWYLLNFILNVRHVSDCQDHKNIILAWNSFDVELLYLIICLFEICYFRYSKHYYSYFYLSTITNGVDKWMWTWKCYFILPLRNLICNLFLFC